MFQGPSVSFIFQRVKPKPARFEVVLDIFERKPSAMKRFRDEAGGV